jgi:hypothetical protein
MVVANGSDGRHGRSGGFQSAGEKLNSDDRIDLINRIWILPTDSKDDADWTNPWLGMERGNRR